MNTPRAFLQSVAISIETPFWEISKTSDGTAFRMDSTMQGDLLCLSTLCSRHARYKARLRSDSHSGLGQESSAELKVGPRVLGRCAAKTLICAQQTRNERGHDAFDSYVNNDVQCITRLSGSCSWRSSHLFMPDFMSSFTIHFWIWF